MKVEFFGTSHGIPTDIRYCTSVCIEVNGARYLFDAGAPVVHLFLRKNYPISSLRAVFVSHMHGDHVAGLPELLDLSNWALREAAFTTYFPEESGISMINNYVATVSSAALREELKLAVVEEGICYEDENIRVRAVRVDHVKDLPSYGYLIEAEGKRVYFSGDMSYDLHDFPALLYDTEVNLLITEFAHCEASVLYSHLAKCKADRICLNHIWPLEKRLPDMAAVWTRSDSPIVAEDNMMIEI